MWHTPSDATHGRGATPRPQQASHATAHGSITTARVRPSADDGASETQRTTSRDLQRRGLLTAKKRSADPRYDTGDLKTAAQGQRQTRRPVCRVARLCDMSGDTEGRSGGLHMGRSGPRVMGPPHSDSRDGHRTEHRKPPHAEEVKSWRLLFFSFKTIRAVLGSQQTCKEGTDSHLRPHAQPPITIPYYN